MMRLLQKDTFHKKENPAQQKRYNPSKTKETIPQYTT